MGFWVTMSGSGRNLRGEGLVATTAVLTAEHGYSL